MRVLVCVKRVPAPGATILVTGDGMDIESKMLGFAVSPHEECAVEEAVRIVETHGGSATVMTLGPPEADEQLKAAVAIGVASAVLLPTDGSDWDPMATAAALVEGIRTVEEREGVFDLILFGNESADSGGYQVGVRVARALGRPMVSGIKGTDIADGIVTARRDTPAGSEVYRLPLPSVLGVKEGINLPRYPTLKGRLAAKKVASERIEVVAHPGGQVKLGLESPPQQISETRVLGTGPEAAAAVVDVFEELGVV